MHKDLLNIAKESMDSDIEVLVRAKEAARANVLDDATASNIAAFERAKKALESAMAAQYKDEDENGQSFSNRLVALEYLQNEGYKIKKSKLYSDSKSGLLKIESDGSITERSLKKYIKKTGLIKMDKIYQNSGREDLLKQKNEKEVQKLDEQIKAYRLQHDLKQKRYISKRDHELELASRAAALYAHLEHVFHLHAGDIIDAAIGTDRESQLNSVRNTLRQYLEVALTEFASIENYYVIMNDNDGDLN